MDEKDLYFYDVQIVTRYLGKPISVNYFAAMFGSTELYRAAVGNRLPVYRPPISDSQIATLFRYAADLCCIVVSATKGTNDCSAWLDIYERIVDAGGPIWDRHPNEQRSPPTWRPRVEEYAQRARAATGACRSTVISWINGEAAPIGRYRKLLDEAGLSMVGGRSAAGTPEERRGRPRRGVKAIVVRAGRGDGAEDIAQLEEELRARGFCVGAASVMAAEAEPGQGCGSNRTTEGA